MMTKKELAKFTRRERDKDFGNPNKSFVDNELLFFLKDRQNHHHRYMFVERKKFFVEFIEIGCDSYRTMLRKPDEESNYAHRRKRITRALL